MSLAALLGAVEIGAIYGLVALGVYLSFRVLNFPDLTVDGSFTLGAAITATLIINGHDPLWAMFAAVLAGALAGWVTAFLNLVCGILHLLASILTMTALYTINLRVMGKPNLSLILEPTLLTRFDFLGLDQDMLRPLVVGIIAVLVALALAAFLSTAYGLALRATGANPRMARANGINTTGKTQTGMALSNALVALAGALFAQTNGFADAAMGMGTIVVGLAAVIIGETLLPSRSMLVAALACLAGSLLYRLVVAAALNTEALGLTAADLSLITALLVGMALVLPKLKSRLPRLRRTP